MNIPKCPTWNDLIDDFNTETSTTLSPVEKSQPEILKIIAEKESTLREMKKECDRIIEFLKEQNLLSNAHL